LTVAIRAYIYLSNEQAAAKVILERNNKHIEK
jgi:hypothetical protein